MQQVNDVVERVFAGVLGAYDTWAIYVGDKLGLYRALASGPALTAGELAERTDIHPRYALEWLEQQAVSGFLEYSGEGEERRFSLPRGGAEVFTDADSLNFLAPFVRLVTAAGIRLPELLSAYRSGEGVSWAEFGEDMRTGQAEMNRPWFLKAPAPTGFLGCPRSTPS